MSKLSISSEPASDALNKINDWQPVSRFCELCPEIPEKTIRWQLTQRHRNGLAPHVKVIGKQRYISVSGYAAWLQSNG